MAHKQPTQPSPDLHPTPPLNIQRPRLASRKRSAVRKLVFPAICIISAWVYSDCAVLQELSSQRFRACCKKNIGFTTVRLQFGRVRAVPASSADACGRAQITMSSWDHVSNINRDCRRWQGIYPFRPAASGMAKTDGCKEFTPLPGIFAPTVSPFPYISISHTIILPTFGLAKPLSEIQGCGCEGCGVQDKRDILGQCSLVKNWSKFWSRKELGTLEFRPAAAR